ncbi:hypothetical protein [Leptolyngbya sp. FACHB-16]|uniref:hypothetical protein n=1 Tax=unclassified Leptolyngbya TaxID=2650499 RepID=UPI00168A3DF3|nr:hypothetical protein [Leptolyngbya sp. FACHB-16]MBD2156022.1 hypothetical protein [Leptolyngbya sp. FACHB-16]
MWEITKPNHSRRSRFLAIAPVTTASEVDLLSTGELFVEADEMGNAYLAPEGIEARNAVRAAMAAV